MLLCGNGDEVSFETVHGARFESVEEFSTRLLLPTPPQNAQDVGYVADILRISVSWSSSTQHLVLYTFLLPPAPSHIA